VLTLVIGVMVIKPLTTLVAMLKEIAEKEGDLTLRLATTDGKDEISEVSRWFNRFVENIQGIMVNVSVTTAQVATASTQLHATAEQIATAAEEVACQTTTAATASEEMSATSNDISLNCSLAADVASQASQMANDGSAIVQQTLQGMEQIANRVRDTAKTVESLGGRSHQIGAIVSTIEDIADQTNLLALNAAIEAARAGDMGRGFAVVADEVRALAERTARATSEIAEMIKGIQTDTAGAVASMDSGVKVVELGMESSRRSGEALEQILQAITEVTMQVHQIATAAEEQTSTTTQISANINEMTVVVQQTANGAHETATAASSLSNSAHELEMLVGKFRISRSEDSFAAA
jgi:methyl-accepting chemotaxis protein